MTSLDLNKFPEIENSIGLLVFDHLKEFPTLKNLGDITQRIYGCSTFLYSGKSSDKDDYILSRSASLRAALNEFVSLSEMLKASNTQNLKNLAIEKMDYPLFHFFKLLREVNFHLNSLQHSHSITNVRNYNTTTGEIDENIITLKPLIIDSLNASLFQHSRNLKFYDINQIATITDWVNTNQYQWGIFYILDIALRQYCTELLDQYSR